MDSSSDDSSSSDSSSNAIKWSDDEFGMMDVAVLVVVNNNVAICHAQAVIIGSTFLSMMALELKERRWKQRHSFP